MWLKVQTRDSSISLKTVQGDQIKYLKCTMGNQEYVGYGLLIENWQLIFEPSLGKEVRAGGDGVVEGHQG